MARELTMKREWKCALPVSENVVQAAAIVLNSEAKGPTTADRPQQDARLPALNAVSQTHPCIVLDHLNMARECTAGEATSPQHQKSSWEPQSWSTARARTFSFTVATTQGMKNNAVRRPSAFGSASGVPLVLQHIFGLVIRANSTLKDNALGDVVFCDDFNRFEDAFRSDDFTEPGQNTRVPLCDRMVCAFTTN